MISGTSEDEVEDAVAESVREGEYRTRVATTVFGVLYVRAKMVRFGIC